MRLPLHSYLLKAYLFEEMKNYRSLSIAFQNGDQHNKKRLAPQPFIHPISLAVLFGWLIMKPFRSIIHYISQCSLSLNIYHNNFSIFIIKHYFRKISEY